MRERERERERENSDLYFHFNVYLPVSKWCDNQPWCVAKILVGVHKLCITDVSKAVLLLFIPSLIRENKRDPLKFHQYSQSKMYIQ